MRLIYRNSAQPDQLISSRTSLLGLLPEEFTGEHADANFRYYEPLCGHGSSLSSGMHGLVAARLGYSDLALRYFQRAAAIDSCGYAHDYRRRFAHGLSRRYLAHGGLAGRLSFQSDEIAFNPKLPAKSRSLGFAIEWRGRRLNSGSMLTNLLQATLESGNSMNALGAWPSARGSLRARNCLPSLVVPQMLQSLSRQSAAHPVIHYVTKPAAKSQAVAS